MKFIRYITAILFTGLLLSCSPHDKDISQDSHKLSYSSGTCDSTALKNAIAADPMLDTFYAAHEDLAAFLINIPLSLDSITDFFLTQPDGANICSYINNSTIQSIKNGPEYVVKTCKMKTAGEYFYTTYPCLSSFDKADRIRWLMVSLPSFDISKLNY